MKSKSHNSYPSLPKNKKRNIFFTKSKEIIPEYKIEINKLLLFSEGKGLSGNYVYYFFWVVVLFFLTLTIPAILFPTHYTISKYFISAMGNYSKNPLGAFIFNSGIIFIGFLQIPIYMFLYQELKVKSKKLAKISCTLSIISAIGYIIVGNFPENIHIPHLIGAFLVFVGFFLAANIDLFIIINIKEWHDKFKTQASLLELVYFIIYTVGILYIFSTVLNLFFQDNVLHSYTIFSPSLWEWMYNLALILWLISIFGYMNGKFIIDKIKASNLFRAFHLSARSLSKHY